MRSVYRPHASKKETADLAVVLLGAFSSSSMSSSSSSTSSSEGSESTSASSSAQMVKRPQRLHQGVRAPLGPMMGNNYPYHLGVLQNRAETHHIVNEALKDREKKLEERRNLVKRIGSLITGLGANNVALNIRKQAAVQPAVAFQQPMVTAQPIIVAATPTQQVAPPAQVHFQQQVQVPPPQQLHFPQSQAQMQPQTVQLLMQPQAPPNTVTNAGQQQIHGFQIPATEMAFPTGGQMAYTPVGLMGASTLCPYHVIKEAVKGVLPGINEPQNQKAIMAERDFQNYVTVAQQWGNGAQWDAVKAEHDQWLRASA